jgi:hypothetical protein
MGTELSNSKWRLGRYESQHFGASKKKKRFLLENKTTD